MCATRTITHIYIIHTHYTCTVEVHCTNIHTESVHVCKHIYTSTYIRISCVHIYITPPLTSYTYARTHVHATHTYTSARVYIHSRVHVSYTQHMSKCTARKPHINIHIPQNCMPTPYIHVSHMPCISISPIPRVRMYKTYAQTHTGIFHMYTRIYK